MQESVETPNSPLDGGVIPATNEPALAPETVVTATTLSGKISVRAGKGLQRWLTWNGTTRHLEMVPRTKKWFGSLGLTGQGTWPHVGEGTVAMSYDVEEGLQHFKTPKHASKWIYAQTKIMTYVWRNDGLMVGWQVDTREGVRISVCLWQVLISGKMPKALPDAQDESIIVE